MSTDSTGHLVGESGVEQSSRRWLRGLLLSLRPHQWVKNLFVLAPLFFAQAFWEWGLLLQGVVATLLFCLMAGTVYLINDLVDVEKDRLHPVKCRRPIAAGQLSVERARRAAWIIGCSTLVAAAMLQVGFALVLLLYLVMNLAYSRKLKEWAFIDVGIIAIGFVLRVVAGGLASGVFLSEWLILCTFLLASYLGLGKRRHEVAMYLSGGLKDTRRVLKRYSLENIDVALFFVAGMTIAAYSIYTLTAALPDQPLRQQDTPFGSPYLPVTIPLVVLGLARFFQLAQSKRPVSPTEALLRDRTLLMTVVLWGATLVALVLL